MSAELQRKRTSNGLEIEIEAFKSKLSKSRTRGSKNGVEWGANGGRKVKEKTPEQYQGERAQWRKRKVK